MSNPLTSVVSIIVLLSVNVNIYGQLSLADFQSCMLSKVENNRIISIKKDLNLRNYSSSARNYAPKFSFNLSPQYSETLSPITQPDGTLKDYNVHTFSVAPSFSANFPIIFSGGTISISNSLNFYRNINGINSYSNYNANIFQIGISQPLSFYSSYKWGKKSAKASYDINLIETVRDYLKLRDTATGLYFQCLILMTNISNLEKQINQSDTIIAILSNLYEAGKVLNTEVNEAKIDKKRKNLHLRKLNIQKRALLEDIIANMGIDVKMYNLQYPYLEKQFCELNEREMFDILRLKQKYIRDRSNISYEYSIAEAKNKKRILPSIQAGIGNNGSGSNLPEVWDKRRLNYNISLSFSIPISDIYENDNKLRIAQLNYEQKMIQDDKLEAKEEIRLKEILALLKESYVNIAVLIDTRNLYEEERKIAYNLLCAGKSLYDNYAKIQNRLLENENEIVSTIRDAYNYLYDIESLLLYDIKNHTSYLCYENH